MRTKTVLLALLTLAATALPLASAQAQAKIGVVNVARLLQEAPQAQAASQALENEFAARKRELQNMERDLKARDEKLQKDGATMAEAERATRRRRCATASASSRKQNEFMEDLNVRRNEALGQLQRSVLAKVQAYAKTASLDLVIADALFASPSIDITAQVLAALQAKGRAPAKP